MARTPDDDLQRLKRNISLADLCRSRGIVLKPHGRKDLVGKCPFHDDEKPSFVVTPDKNLFHCMGCDAAGSVIDFVMKLDGLDFKAAVDKLLPGLRGAGRAAPAPAAAERKSVALAPERAAQLLDRVIAIYEKSFAETPDGRAYLERRGIGDAGLFTRHRIGYAAGALADLLPKDGAVRDELKALGILMDGDRERFAGCVVVPVYGPDGELVTLYGRFTGDGPKRHLFLPDRSTGLWNAAAVKTYPDIILVESIIDALSVMMAGHANVLATQGTNGLSDADLATLRTHGVTRVTLMLDGDDAGGRATGKLRPKLEAQGITVTVKALPAEHDPNSYLVQHGAEALARFLASAAWTPNEMKDLNAADVGPGPVTVRASGAGAPTPPAVQAHGLAVTYGLRRYEIRGLDKSARRLKATVRVEHAGKLHVDTLDFYSARSRRILAQDLCRLFEETPETIEADLDKLLRHCEALPAQTDAGGAGPDGRPAEAALSAKDRAEAEAFGKAPDLVEKILADFEACGLMGEASNKLLSYLAAVSRKMDAPLSVLVLSSSGAGKTALQDTALAFVPPEDLVKLTSLSGKALFYKERTSLKHKVLALEEGAGAEEASYAIRNLISAGELVIESTIKDLATGRLTTMENRVEGPTAVFITTTNPDTDPETKTRFWVTSIDESREQTRRILDFQRRRQTLDGVRGGHEVQAIHKRHHNFQRLLQPLAVVNPFAEKLAYGDDRLQGRRDQPKYLNLIKAVAFLRQMTRPVLHAARNGDGFAYIEVLPDDVRLANRLAHDILGHSLDELSRPSRALLLELERMVRERLVAPDGGAPAAEPDTAPRLYRGTFSRREIRQQTGWSNYRVHTHLKELIEYEYVSLETDRLTSGHRYRLLYDGQGKDGERFVLGLTDPATL